jgi:hypothetical protein
MAATNLTVAVPANTWTQLTTADASAITFQNTSQYTIMVKATTDATTPTTQTDVLIYGPGEGETNLTMANKWLGLTSPDRLWAYCQGKPASVFVSHA